MDKYGCSDKRDNHFGTNSEYNQDNVRNVGSDDENDFGNGNDKSDGHDDSINDDRDIDESEERTRMSYEKKETGSNDKSRHNNEKKSSKFPPATEPISNVTHSDEMRSQEIDYLTHPLDRSIALVFMLTVFFTLLALVSGAPIVIILFGLLAPTLIIKRCCACDLGVSSSGHIRQEKISPIDSYWLTSGHITHCLLYIDKGFSIDHLRDIITTRILARPELVRFKSKLIYKGLSRTPYWQLNSNLNDELNFVESHVIQDEPILSKRLLKLRLKELMSHPLPDDKPLWQIRWAHANYCNQVVLIIRIHQSLCDGVGLISILVQYLSDTPPSIVSVKPRFGGSTLPINIFRAIIVGPLTFFLWLLWAFTRRHHNYLKISKNKSFKSIYSTSYDLAKVYRIKQVTRSSLNDVLLSAISGAIRTYLTNKTHIFNPPNLNISIPIDIRPTIHYDPTVGINFVLVTSPIPTNTEGAIPRLWEVRHLMEELKTSADTAVMYGAHYLLTRLLPISLSRFLINLVNRNSSLCVSNLQGPSTNLSIGSYRLNKIHYFMSPPPYTSTVFNIITYNGRIYFSVSSTSHLISNSKSLARLFKSQLNRLSNLLSRRRVPGEGRRRKSRIPIDLPVYQNAPSPNANDLTSRLHQVQFELQQLSEELEHGESGVIKRFEELKDEFTGLMLEMRRRKSIAEHGPSIVINIEEDEDDDIDGELRPPPTRRFSVVSIASRRTSIVSGLPSSSRVTPPILSRRGMTTSPEPPSSPEVAFKSETEC